MLVTIKENSFKNKIIEIPDNWTCIVPKEFETTFNTKRTINGHKQIIASKYSIDKEGYLGYRFDIVINEFYPGDYSFSLTDTEFLVGMTLSEVKKVVTHYMDSWKGDIDNTHVGLISFTELEKFKENLINKNILLDKNKFNFDIDIFISEKGVNNFSKMTIPAIKIGNFALHRKVQSITYMVSHIKTTEAIAEVKNTDDGKKVIKVLLGTGIDWDIDNHNDLLAESLNKNIRKVLEELQDKGLTL